MRILNLTATPSSPTTAAAGTSASKLDFLDLLASLAQPSAKGDGSPVVSSGAQASLMPQPAPSGVAGSAVLVADPLPVQDKPGSVKQSAAKQTQPTKATTQDKNSNAQIHGSQSHGAQSQKPAAGQAAVQVPVQVPVQVAVQVAVASTWDLMTQNPVMQGMTQANDQVSQALPAANGIVPALPIAPPSAGTGAAVPTSGQAGQGTTAMQAMNSAPQISSSSISSGLISKTPISSGVISKTLISTRTISPGPGEDRASGQTAGETAPSQQRPASGASNQDGKVQLSTTDLAAKIAATVVLPQAMPVAQASTAVLAPVIAFPVMPAAAAAAPVAVTSTRSEVEMAPTTQSANPTTAAAASEGGNLIPSMPGRQIIGQTFDAAQPADVNSQRPASDDRAPVQAKGGNQTAGAATSDGNAGQPAQAASTASTFTSALGVAASAAAAMSADSTTAQAGVNGDAAAAVKTALTPAISTVAGTTTKASASAPAPTTNTQPGNASAGKTTDPSNTSNAGKSASTSPAQPASQGNAGTQTSANGGGAAQHSQADAGQAGAGAKAGDAAAAMPAMPTMAQPSAAHDSAPVQSRADAAGTMTRGADQGLPARELPTQGLPAQGSELAASSAINAAKVIQNMSETEMRVGMHSAEFGDISIRTAVSMQQMTAQISVDHSDLGKAISAHIPAMEQKLGGEFGVRATVEVSQGGMTFSNERGSAQQQEYRTSAAPGMQFESTQISAEQDTPAARAASIGADSGRLDIRA